MELQGRCPVVCREPEGPRSTTGRASRPSLSPLAPAERMEENARELARHDGITEGLVCVYGAMETCRTFRVRYGDGCPELARSAGMLGHLLLLDGSGIRI